MARFIIRGGRSLAGRHRPPGNKNAALPMLAACVLTDRPVTLHNVPLIEDVHNMLRILEALGVDVQLDGHAVKLCASGLQPHALSAELCSRVRASILFAGPLAARHGEVALYPPGGDVIGRRRLDTHFAGLQALGIELEGENPFRLERRELQGARILLDEASVTATENILMAAVLAPGRTTIFNAACEPHVQDLCRMLTAMGASIGGIGTNYLQVEGVATLGGVAHELAPDHVDAASFAAAARVTGGSLVVDGAPVDQMDVVARPFGKLGMCWRQEGRALHIDPGHPLRVENDLGGAIPKIEDGTWPAFPSDLMSVAIVVATQAEGTMLFFEKLFESRMYFVDRLIAMGARIIQCDPHRVIVSGPARLRGTHVSSPDIRAGMGVILAALCAQGESVIDNAQVVDRGYEAIDARLRRLGADIERVE